MRHAFIGLCIFTAACSGQSPTSPSGLAGVGAQTQASGGARSVGTFANGTFKIASPGAPMDPVEVTFTKWITAFPAMAGVTGGDVPGTFAGAVLSRNPFDNGTIVQLEARYGVTAADPAHSFIAVIEGKQNNQTQAAVLNGTVIAEWMNVSNQWDQEVDWFQSHEHFLREGYVWVGVSAQRAGLHSRNLRSFDEPPFR